MVSTRGRAFRLAWSSVDHDETYRLWGRREIRPWYQLAVDFDSLCLPSHSSKIPLVWRQWPSVGQVQLGRSDESSEEKDDDDDDDDDDPSSIDASPKETRSMTDWWSDEVRSTNSSGEKSITIVTFGMFLDRIDAGKMAIWIGAGTKNKASQYFSRMPLLRCQGRMKEGPPDLLLFVDGLQ